MPRPKKWRNICCLPQVTYFGPFNTDSADNSIIVMTIDEFETIRLIDHENLSQEECSRRMNVARTTVQAIYSSARKKLADCIVNSKELRIEGGDYKLCDGKSCQHCCRCCRHTEDKKAAD